MASPAPVPYRVPDQPADSTVLQLAVRYQEAQEREKAAKAERETLSKAIKYAVFQLAPSGTAVMDLGASGIKAGKNFLRLAARKYVGYDMERIERERPDVWAVLQHYRKETPYWELDWVK